MWENRPTFWKTICYSSPQKVFHEYFRQVTIFLYSNSRKNTLRVTFENISNKDAEIYKINIFSLNLFSAHFHHNTYWYIYYLGSLPMVYSNHGKTQEVLLIRDNELSLLVHSHHWNGKRNSENQSLKNGKTHPKSYRNILISRLKV